MRNFLSTNHHENTPSLTVLQLCLFGAVVTTTGAFLLRQLYDPDVWWHIVIGTDILRNLSIPVTDRFAAAALGNPYHDSHWLFQVLLALVHRFSGMKGICLAVAGIWGGTLYFAYRSIRQWVSPEVAGIILFLVAITGEERFIPRPETVTFLMIAFFYWLLLERKHAGWTGLACLTVAQVIWANSHGLFVIGPFMVGCYWLGAVIRQLRYGQKMDASLHVAILTVLGCMLATPYGIGGIRYAFTLLSEVGPGASATMKSVGELQPTFSTASLSGIGFWSFLALLVTVAAITALNVVSRRQVVSPERLLICIGLAFAAGSASRNMPLFALAAGPWLAEQIYLATGHSFTVSKKVTVAATVVISAMAVLPLSNIHYASKTPTRFGLGVAPFWYPLGLPAFLAQSGFKGQVFNSASLGGFYLYHSYPERVPYMDGRWEVYGDKKLDKIRLVVENASTDRASWEAFVSANRIEALLLQHLSPEAEALLPMLPLDPGWRLAYFDSAASFWLRVVPPGSGGMDLAATSHVTPFTGRDNWEMLDWFLQTVHAPDDVRRFYMSHIQSRWN